MMKKALLLFLVLSCQLTFGQVPVKDLLDAINWNQNEEEFIGQWSELLVKVEHFHNKYGRWHRDYEFHNVYLSDMELSLGIGIEDEDHSIREIHGTFVSYNRDLDTFNKAEGLLRSIYGAPNNIEDKLNRERIKSKDVTWYYNGYKLVLSITIYSDSSFIVLSASKNGDGKPTIQITNPNKSKSQFENDGNKLNSQKSKKEDIELVNNSIITFNFVTKKNAVDQLFLSNGEDYYIVPFPGKTAHDLFSDMLVRIIRLYNSPETVTEKVEDRTIVINGYASHIAELSSDEVNCHYRLEFNFKDGKIRVNPPKLSNITATLTFLEEIRTYDATNLWLKDYDTTCQIEKYFNDLVNNLVYGNSKDDDW